MTIIFVARQCFVCDVSELLAVCECTSTYHKSADAPLWRFPFEAAVDVAACADQEHDAAPNSVEVAQQQLQKEGKEVKKKKVAGLRS